jgi:hypothetical protein
LCRAGARARAQRRGNGIVFLGILELSELTIGKPCARRSEHNDDPKMAW